MLYKQPLGVKENGETTRSQRLCGDFTLPAELSELPGSEKEILGEPGGRSMSGSFLFF